LMLDPFAGHGTFITGLIADVAPGCTVTVEAGLSSYGDTDDKQIAQSLRERFPIGVLPQYDIVSMSFAGFCLDDDPPLALSAEIARIQLAARDAADYHKGDLIAEGVVFVASAGNDASPRCTWPASFESVISVGALGPDGPAPFTNYGAWVQASAPGVDIVSTFFDLTKEDALFDATDFRGWAQWSGTSFSAPTVAAEIAWEWMGRGCSGRVGEVAEWLLHRDGVYRHPWLGTVFND